MGLHTDTERLVALTHSDLEPPSFGRGPRCSMLVVDDDPPQADIVSRMLSKSGTVYTAYNAPDALDLLCANDDIAVLVTDLLMPVFDGEWLIEKAKCGWPHLKVVCASAYHLNLSRVSGSMIDRRFDKPFNLRQLAIAVSMLVIEAGVPT